MTLNSKVAKIDLKIIISSRESKSVKHSLRWQEISSNCHIIHPWHSVASPKGYEINGSLKLTHSVSPLMYNMYIPVTLCRKSGEVIQILGQNIDVLTNQQI